MDFEIIGEIRQTETFARGSAMRELARLRKFHGQGVGVSVKVTPQFVCLMGRFAMQRFTGMKLTVLAIREFKIKRYLDI